MPYCTVGGPDKPPEAVRERKSIQTPGRMWLTTPSGAEILESGESGAGPAARHVVGSVPEGR